MIDHLLLVPSIGIDLIPGTELKLWAFGAVISRVSSVMVDTDRPLGVHRGLGSRMNRSGMDLGLKTLQFWIGATPAAPNSS